MQYDLILIGGGALVKHHHDFIWCMDYWCRRNGVPVKIIGVGVDNSLSKRETRVYFAAMKKAEKIVVRDSLSQRILLNNGISCEYGPDVAFLYSKLFPEKQCKIASDTVLIDVYGEYSDKEKELYYEKIVNANRAYSHFRIAYTTYLDFLEGKRFIEYLKRKHHNINVSLADTDTLDLLIDEICAVKKVSSGRMHLLVLAMAYQKDIDIQIVSEKLTRFAEQYGKNAKIGCLQDQIERILNSLL